nr:MAG: hypothetical protein [Microvirus sp.]
MNIYILKDKLTNMPAGTHFSSATDASAVRDCLVNFKNHLETANQFDLYRVGVYDNISGEITDTTVTLVCNLSAGSKFIETALNS